MTRRFLFNMLLITSAVVVSGACVEAAIAKRKTVGCTLEQAQTAPETVIEPCSKIIADKRTSRPDQGYALFIRGKGYQSTKRFDLAGQDYDAAILLTPTNDELLASRANIAFRGGRGQEGMDFLQTALTINPRNGRALRAMGRLHASSGYPEEANQYYSMALEADPNDAYALFYRSTNSASLRKFDEALKDADALAAMAPALINRQGYFDDEDNRLDFHIIALKGRADIFDKMGQPDRAEQDLTAAVNYSRSAVSLSARGKFLAYKPSRQQEALSDLDEAISLGISDSRTFYAKGMVQIKLRQYQQALATFDRALKFDPQFAEALRMRGRMYREMDQTDLAVADMRHAISISPSLLKETLPALKMAGYWRSNDIPTALTPALEDAVRACMLDKQCN